MRSPGLALVRDFTGRLRWGLLSFLASSLSLPLLLTMIFRSIGSINERDVNGMFSLAIFMECCYPFILAGGQCDTRSGRFGLPTRLFTLPVSTARLVFWQIVPGAAVAAGLHFLTAFWFWALTGHRVPTLEPALLLAGVYICGAAVIWSLTGLALMRMVLAVLVCLPLWWRLLSFTNISLPYIESFRHLGEGWILPALTLLIIAAYGAAVAGVARDRRGGAGAFPKLRTLAECAFGFLPGRRRRFASPAGAQLWFEWRQKGLLFPICVLLPTVLIYGIQSFFSAADLQARLYTLLGMAYYIFIPGSVIVGLLMGQMDLEGRKFGIDLFRATRPLSDCAQATAALKMGALSLAAGWLICVAELIVGLAAFWLTGHPEAVRGALAAWVKEFGIRTLGLWSMPLLLTAMLIPAWILLSFTYVFGMIGRRKTVGAVGGVALMVLIIVVPLLALKAAKLGMVLAFLTLVLMGSAGLAGTAGGIYYAWRRRLIGGRMAAVSAALWVLIVGAGAVLYLIIMPPSFHNGSAPMMIFYLGFLALAPSTPTLGTLAVHWNRHR